LATTLVPTPLPPPPPLNNVDPSKIDEIRRTVYVGNLDTTVRIWDVYVEEPNNYYHHSVLNKAFNIVTFFGLS